MKHVILVLLIAVGIAAGAASPAVSTAVNCGTIRVAGKSWGITAAGIRCSDAKAVVQKLAVKPVPAGAHYSGTYLGMGCLGGVFNGRRGIECAGKRGQLLIAFTTK